jgi:hypothetical protein
MRISNPGGGKVDDRTSRLESAVERLQLTVVSLQQRVDAIEARKLDGASSAAVSVAESSTETGPVVGSERPRAKDPYDPIVILSLVGRLLLVLAGGFFLRAMTDAGTLAVPVGIAMAFAYAAAWLFLSYRAGGRRQVPNAVVHALAAALTAFPLLVEATTRFKVLSGPASAVVVSVLSAGFLFVAWRRQLRALTWITVFGALPTSGALLLQTGLVAPFALFLIALGLATLWLSYSTNWWGSRWPTALAADLAVAGVTLRAFAPEHRDTPQVAMALLLLLLVGYFASIAVRTLIRGRDVSRFEIVQAAVALAVSLGGAVFMARATDGVPAPIGVVAMLLGAACYGAALTLVERRDGSALNFYFYTTTALVLVLAGVTIAVGGAWFGAVFALFSVLAARLWSRGGRLFLLLHAAVYIVAAGIVSGSFGYSAQALLADAQGAWAAPDAIMVVVLAAGALSAGLAATRPLSGGDEVAIGARFIITIALVWIAGGSLIGFIAPLAGGLAADRSVDQGVLATVSTGVLSMAALLVAWMGRHERCREWGWLVYPLLVGIGLKLVAQDFKHSRPATLFIALALFGAALIIAPRLRRRVEKLTDQSGA